MNSEITPWLVIAVIWIGLNFVTRLKAVRKRVENVKVYYGAVLVVKVNRELKPSSKRRLKLLGVTGLITYLMALALSIQTLLSTILYGVQTGERNVVLLVPGFNVTGEDLLLFLLAVFVAISLHECMHAIFARELGIPVKSWGFILALIVPVAFVEVDEQAFSSSPRIARISVLSAGIASNLVLAILTMFLLQFMVNPYGFIVTHIEPGSLAEKSGLMAYDVIYEINNTRATIEVLENYLNHTEKTVLVFKIYRKGEGFLNISVRKDLNETRLGARLFLFAPSYAILNFVKPTLFIYLFKAFLWQHIVNFSLMFINTLPLFITDGGKIIDEVLGKAGRIVNAVIAALLIIMLLISARI